MVTKIAPSRVAEYTSTTGTGAYTLDGAIRGMQAVGDALDTGDLAEFFIFMGADWERIRGTYTLATNSIARTVVLESSNSGAAVNWAAGRKTILAGPAESCFANSGVELSLPGKLYAASGREINCYFANVFHANYPSLIEPDVTCAKGKQQNERWTHVASDDDVSSGNVSDIAWQLDLYAGGSEDVVASVSPTLRIAKSTSGTTKYGGANLCPNPGFETNIAAGTDWTAVTTGGTVTQIATTPKFGAKCLRMTRTTTGTLSVYTAAGIIACDASTAYRWTFWTRGDGTNAGRYQVSAWNGTAITPIVAEASTGVTAATWTQVVVDFTTEADATSVFLYQRAPSANGYADFDGNVLQKVSTAARKVLIIGDSTCNGDPWQAELINLHNYNRTSPTGGGGEDALTVDLVGTIESTVADAGTTDRTFSHEGKSGWTWAMHHSNAESSFLFGGVFNFGAYNTALSDDALVPNDWVLIHLGINDVFSATSDITVDYLISTAIQPAIAGMLGIGDAPASTTIRGAVPGVRIGLMLPIAPSQDQDAFGDDYAAGQHRRRYKRNIDRYRKWLIDTYGSMEADGIYLIPVHANVDPYYGMPFASAAAVNVRSATTIARQDNGVHPDVEGYYQMADAVYSFLKGQET